MKKYIRSAYDDTYGELLDQLDNQVYQVWENYRNDGLDPSEVLDIVIEHLEYIAISEKDFMKDPFPKNWKTIVKQEFDDMYDKYTWNKWQ